jgi:Cd2+/Zn2+-exporting ATPase
MVAELGVLLKIWDVSFFMLSVLSGGFETARTAFHSLKARMLDMNVLMAVAVAGAVAIGKW